MDDNEKKEAATSGQLGPKSKKPHKQFRQDSAQPRPSDRLRDKAETSDYAARAEKKHAERMEKSAFRAERTGAKLESAVEKRNKQKPPKNPGPIKSVRKAATYELYRYAHGKIHQAEDENVGVEAAHRTELTGERVIRGTSRFVKQRIRTRPARQVRKWEKRDIKAKADLQFRKLAHDHPELRKNIISRFMQKQRLKRRYQKQAREAAKKGAKAAKKTAVTVEKIVAAVGRFVVSHPVISLIVVLLFVIIAMLQSCTGFVGLLGGGVGGTVEGVADTAETVCTQFETDLQAEIANIENARPGYDEYRYNMGTVGHNINEIMGFLMVYQAAPGDDLEAVLRSVFDEQYTLSFTEITEERETENEDGETVTEEISILEITLTSRPFAEVIASHLTPEQLAKYESYNYTP
ncbi:MAG: hypothetical protein LBI55_02480 [Oscillospiraceae bacterium]|jgi:hypothetical protein|nr:hypothetical protein [Oscillospiraceae bacterium]